MDTAEQLLMKLDYLCEMQPLCRYVLLGFHLTARQLDNCRSLLTEDDPDVGAVGRYRSVPVYDIARAPIPDERRSDVYEGVCYVYFEPRSVF